MKKTVVVFSGGQDSTTCLIQALEQMKFIVLHLIMDNVIKKKLR